MQRAVLLLGVGVSLGLFGCAHEEEIRPAEAPMFEAAPPPAPPVYAAPVAAARPRLDHTVTLGEGDYSPAPAGAPAPSQGQGQGPNVTVNNNIYVQPSGYGYGSYGYGYGGYGGYAYRGSRTPVTNGDGRTFVTPWRGSGWEGAQRTAAPGQTPAVGGNYAPPPSFGPQQMK